MNLKRKTQNGYIYDKRIFIITMMLCLSLAWLTLHLMDYNFNTQIYFECDQDTCQNPLMEMDNCKTALTAGFGLIKLYITPDCRDTCTEAWCTQPILLRGIYGKEKPLLYDLLPYFCVLLVILSFVLNHQTHNKGKEFDIEIVITEKKKISIRDIIRRLNHENNN